MQEDSRHSDQIDLWKQIYEGCSTRFVGWILFSTNSIGSNGSLQPFYLTLLNYYFGLSRSGITINSKYGMGVPLSTFDKIRKEKLEEAKQQTRLRLQGNHVLWYDNFSKFRKHTVPTIRKDVFSQCLWTGVTVNSYQGPYVNPNIRYDRQNKIIPAMPDDIFVYKDSVTKGIMTLYDEGSDFFNCSLVKKFEVNNIPLKIDTAKYPAMGSTINSEANTLKHIHPWKLIEKNIGSNNGLISILRDLQIEHGMNEDGCRQPSKYIVMNVDENIYERILKVAIC